MAALTKQSSYSSASSPLGSSGTASRSDHHALGLKVMRLRKPEFFIPNVIHTESTDLIPSFGGENASTLSSMLTLPKDFGQIYVGETFRSYLSLYNYSSIYVHNAVIKVELQTQQKTTLLDTSSAPVMQFPPKTNKEYVVEHALTEAGMHTLVCIVQYNDDSSDPKVFRKIFKFSVNNPLAIKTVKIYTLKDHFFVLLELQNAMSTPLFLESVVFEPNVAFNLTDHSPHPEESVCEPPMASNEVQRFLFELAPVSLISHTGPRTALGRIEIKWKTNHGECGHLVTNTIEHKSVEKQDVELLVDEVPDCVAMEAPFEINLSVKNLTDRELELAVFLHIDRMYPLAFNGPSFLKLGLCSPQSSLPMRLVFFAMSSGLLNLNGMEIRDLKAEKVYSFSNLCTLFVKH